LDATGTFAIGTSGTGGSAGLGINISAISTVPSYNIRIGTDGNGNGFDADERNVIAGNLWSRFLNVDNGPTNVTIAGNYLGTDKTGLSLVGTVDHDWGLRIANNVSSI